MGYQYREDNTAIIDVTKPPYNADKTGKEDCTEALRRAFDDVLRPNIDALEETKQKLLAMEDPNARIGFEIRKENGILYVIFPEELNPTKILYFPNGTYLVSNTITYSLENLANIFHGLPYMEMNRQIYFKGESRDGVIIKLKDSCPGFEYGSNKPVINFMLGEKSNIAMTNSFEDITIDVGKNNPGAVGLVFFGNNTGTVRNVKILSSDEQKRGYAGLEIKHEMVSGCFVNHVEVDGFNYGVRAIPLRNFMVFEDILVKNQKKAGFFINNAIISIRRLKSINKVVGISIVGAQAHVALVDSEILGDNPFTSAINCDLGSCFIRNVKTRGYAGAMSYAEQPEILSDDIEEYVSEKIFSLFPNELKSEALPVEETPQVPWPESSEEWASVNEFGAAGDGVTDDTQAIQAAMLSGKKHIFFQPGKYLVTGSITVPENVVRINFMYCDFVAGETVKAMSDRGVFVITGDEGTILLEDVFTWEQFYGYMRFIEHAGKRTLVMSDLHTQTAAMYFNSVEGGKVFIENCGCTLGAHPYRDTPAYAFKGQKVWARHINPERSMKEILNDHSKVWILGFKTESYGTAFETINGGHTEVLGGTISIGRNRELPAILNYDSTVSLVASTNGCSLDHIFPLAIEERQNGEIRQLMHDVFPIRLLNNYKIPLYIGRKQGE
ncbi:MAG: hypothetical protein IJ390_08860 [Lachnospiraceae bacterium]|nr:hypothetical protein [Lachnospiraceae bacterium]